MTNKITKMFFIAVMMISLMSFLLCNKTIIMIISGVTLWLSALIVSEIIIDKKNTSKIKWNEKTIYLIDSKMPSSKLCRTMGTINPEIAVDSRFFSTLSNETQTALLFHELNHALKKHNLKRFFIFGLIISLYTLSRLVVIKESNLESLCITALLGAVLFYIIYYRKNEYQSDLFSVEKSKNSKPLVEWLTIQANNEPTHTLSLHPSYRNRIRNIMKKISNFK